MDYEQRAQFSRDNIPGVNQLEKKLLSIGGQRIAMGSPTLFGNVEEVLAKGKLIESTDIQFKTMRRSQCHENSEELCNMDPNLKLLTGWALSEDGCWRQHSWAMNNDIVIETTEPRIKYFGY